MILCDNCKGKEDVCEEITTHSSNAGNIIYDAKIFKVELCKICRIRFNRAFEQLFKSFRTALLDESGATSVEYAFVAALVAAVVVLAVKAFGEQVLATLEMIGGAL